MAHDSDSFINEVTEELRRDRLFALMRRYGWIVIALILVLVIAAAVREWNIMRRESHAQAFGDAVLAAQQGADPAEALAAIGATDPGQQALIGMLAADAQVTAGDDAGAASRLQALAAGGGAPALDHHLALLKLVMMQDARMDPAARDAALTELSTPGAPFRLLALEQKAVALIEAGRRDDAVTLIQKITQEQGLTQGLRDRLAQMMMTAGANEGADTGNDPDADGDAGPAGMAPSAPE